MNKKLEAGEGRGDMQGEHDRKEIIMCKTLRSKEREGLL